MDFEIIGEIRNTGPIARGIGVRDCARLRKHYGRDRWRKLKGFASVRLTDGTIHTVEPHWYVCKDRTERLQDQIPVVGLTMRRKAVKVLHFAVCINNEGDKASLVVGKPYRVIPDAKAAAPEDIRVVDEGGEDYRCTAERFFPLEVPQALADALQSAG